MNNLARCFVTLVLTVSFLIASEYFFCYLILHFSFILIVLLPISTHRFSISTQGPDEQVNWFSVQPVQCSNKELPKINHHHHFDLISYTFTIISIILIVCLLRIGEWGPYESIHRRAPFNGMLYYNIVIGYID